MQPDADEIRPEYLTDYLIPQLRQFDRIFSERVFPQFADPQQQANRVARERWEECMALPANGESVDPGDFVDEANDAGLAFYETMVTMQRTVLNLFTAGIYHLLEQQAGVLIRDFTISNRTNYHLADLRAWLVQHVSIDPRNAAIHNDLEQLRHVANVVKHAEGTSAAQLRTLNPDFFREPLLRQLGFADLPGRALPVGAPLAGEDLYVTKEDYDRLRDAAIGYWEWLAAELRRHHE
jgi:hypothetical protein